MLAMLMLFSYIQLLVFEWCRRSEFHLSYALGRIVA